MTAIHDLLTEARQRGITVTLSGGDLRLRGPRVALAPEFLDRMRCHKEEILGVLRARQLPVEQLAKVLPPISSPWGGRPIEERICAVQDLIGGCVFSHNQDGFSLVCDGHDASDLDAAVSSITDRLNAAVVGRGKYGFQVSFPIFGRGIWVIFCFKWIPLLPPNSPRPCAKPACRNKNERWVRPKIAILWRASNPS